MIKSTAITLLAVALVLISSCKKEEDSGYLPITPAATEHPLRQLFADNLAAATQHFTINVDNGPGYVTGMHGLQAAFATHAFRTADGSIATGPIDITLVEAFKVGDMLWLNKQTLGNDNGQAKLLVSGGQYQLTASQGGEALKLAPSMSYISVPTDAPDPNMALFSGTIQADGNMLWNPWPNNPIVATDTTTMDSIPAGGFYYNFPSDSLNWINCDYFYGGGEPLTAVQVTCPAPFDISNTLVWLIFPDLNSIANLSSGSGNTFSTGSGYEVPNGMNVTVVALAVVDDVYSSSFTDVVVTNGINLNITLEPTTLDQFEDAVDGL